MAMRERKRYLVKCFKRAHLEWEPTRLIADIPYGCAETTAASAKQAINNVRFRLLGNMSQYWTEQVRDEVWYFDFEVTEIVPT